jgi:hypothetical protein
MNDSIDNPKGLLIVVLETNEEYSENEYLKNKQTNKRTTPITVTRIISARNENEFDERGFMSACRV